MIKTYSIVLPEDEVGIDCVSLVEMPAVESNFEVFDKQIKLSVDQNHVIGVLLRADYPIYRFDGHEEYYVVFSKEVIAEIARRYASADHVASLNHDGIPVEGVVLEQLFIKNSEKGVNPTGFENISDGSLFAVFKLENQDVLDQIASGDVKGFSIEGWFDRQLKLPESQLNPINNTNMNFKNFKKAVKQFLMNTDIAVEVDGKMLYPEGEDWTVGTAVSYLDSDEAVADGEYKINDVTTIVVADGKIAEVKEAEVKEEELEADPVSEDNDLASIVADLVARVAEIEAKIAKPETEEPEDINKELMSVTKNWHEKLQDLR